MAKALGLEPIKDFDAHNLNRGPASGVCLFPLPTPPPQKKAIKSHFTTGNYKLGEISLEN